VQLTAQENITQKGEDNTYALSGIETHDLSMQAIKAFASDCAVTGNGRVH
jgi:hypothetical protein